ncbi:hypothetical protein CIC12_20370 [Burkholderia sp. SG-MS1]|nr:hypothetical protein [Paraburkholderia sp. SG-MS1]
MSSFSSRLLANASSVLQSSRAISGVLLDDHYPEAAWFGKRLSAQGIKEHIFSGDISQLWIETLDKLWAAAPTTVAGLTTDAALFGLEQLCTQHHMRLKFRADETEGIVASEGALSGSSARSAQRDERSLDWVDRAIDSILAAGESGFRSTSNPDPFSVPIHGEFMDQPRLVAWVIGPIS